MSEEDNKEVTILDLTVGERKFLHELSNKLLVVQGMSKTVHKKLEAKQPITEKEIDRLGKVVKASEAMVELLQERRFLLHSITKTLEGESES